MSVAAARRLGVPADRWVFLHGYADLREQALLARADLGAGPASVLAAQHALDVAGIGVDQLATLDLYSCFPIAVSNVAEGLGLAGTDERPLTLTGGLPFFGGAGNNYSMHAIASMVRALRGRAGGLGLVGANGGFLSKYSVGVYSPDPAPWKPFSSQALQAQIDAWPPPPRAQAPQGAAKVESYTIDHGRPVPRAMAVARTPDGQRFAAMTDDQGVVGDLIAKDPLGATLQVASDDEGRTIIVGGPA
jgi:acetyl-CoA C-acetyltransferase